MPKCFNDARDIVIDEYEDNDMGPQRVTILLIRKHHLVNSVSGYTEIKNLPIGSELLLKICWKRFILLQVDSKLFAERLIRNARMFYHDHIEGDYPLLFEEVVKMDLEGIVCKRKDSPYKVTEKPSRYWIKVKNARYSQLEGREELFERG